MKRTRTRNAPQVRKAGKPAVAKRAGRPVSARTWKEARIALQLLEDFEGLQIGGYRVRVSEAARAAIGEARQDAGRLELVQRVMRELKKPNGRVPGTERAAPKRVEDVLAVGYDAARERPSWEWEGHRMVRTTGYHDAAARLARLYLRRVRN